MSGMNSSHHASFHEVEEVLRSNRRFIVISHMRPDGDAIGSTIAMGEALKQMGKEVILLNEDSVPDNLQFMKGCTEVRQTREGETFEADVLISLDNGAWKRLGDRSIAALADIPFVLNIDHHETNDCYGNMCCIIPDKSSTGEILYHLFKTMNIPFNPCMRDSIYIAVSTDTGSFQYERTTPEVMEMAADLLRMGVDVHEINRQLYQELSWTKLQAQREVLNRMNLSEDGRIAWCALTNACKKEGGITEDDTEGLIDILRSICGVVLAAFFEELPDGRIRISMRSKNQDISVNGVASKFGGGGHALAAGIRMRCSLEDAEQQVLTALKAVLDQTPHQ